MKETETILSDEQRQKELKAELEHHKARFLKASRKGMAIFKSDLSPVNWIRTYPLQCTALAFLGGICLGFAKPLDRHKGPSLP